MNNDELDKILNDRKDCLLESNKRLLQDLQELKEYTNECDTLQKIYGVKYIRGGFFGKMRNLTDFESKWKKTVFWKYHSELDNYRFMTLEQVGNKLQYIECKEIEIRPFNVLAYCDFKMSISGITMINLIDPFSSISLRIDDNQQCADSYVGLLLYITCKKSKGKDYLECLTIQKLPYTLCDKI